MLLVAFERAQNPISKGTKLSFWGVIWRSIWPKQIYTIHDKKFLGHNERYIIPQKLIFAPFESSQYQFCRNRTFVKIWYDYDREMKRASNKIFRISFCLFENGLVRAVVRKRLFFLRDEMRYKSLKNSVSKLGWSSTEKQIKILRLQGI